MEAAVGGGSWGSRNMAMASGIRTLWKDPFAFGPKGGILNLNPT